MTASSTAWNSTPGPWLPYAPVSAVTSSASPVSVPSRVAPSVTVTAIGCRVVAAVNSSSRVSSSWTGRPVRSTASATMSSVSISCLPPNPPPTRFATTRTRSLARPKIRPISSRVRNGTWVDVRSTSRPPPSGPGSSQPIVMCVSSATCWTRWVRNVPE